MSCISISNDESFIYVLVFSVSQCSFSTFWRPENAISAHSSSGLIKSMILDIFVLGLDISVYTTNVNSDC